MAIPRAIQSWAAPQGIRASQLTRQLSFWIYEGHGIMNERGEASYRMPDGSYIHTKPVRPDGLEPPEPTARQMMDRLIRAEYHVAVRGPDIQMVRIKDDGRDYTVDEFIEQFPSLAIFIVPLYGPFTGSTPARDVQEAIREFALELGAHMERRMLVFDFWTRKRFSHAEYNLQFQSIMSRGNFPQGSPRPAHLQPFSLRLDRSRPRPQGRRADLSRVRPFRRERPAAGDRR